jgi:CDP-diacylglycerol--serine O-phosphatidyltransferase
MKLFTLPNIITLLNLLCGCIAIVFAFDGNLVWSAYLVGIAAVLDFLDGFVARALKQYSEIGKQLDSLADMVTFGLVPGVVMFTMIHLAVMHNNPDLMDWPMAEGFFQRYPLLTFVAFVIPLFSALRLAKFNIDTRQSDSFIGVPTPANAILICSFPLILNLNAGSYWAYANKSFSAFSEYDITSIIFLNQWFLIGITIIMSVLLISEIPLFALKFKSFGWKGNEIRWSFLGLCVVLLATLHFVGIPLAIVLYILMSVINNLVAKNKARG